MGAWPFQCIEVKTIQFTNDTKFEVIELGNLVASVFKFRRMVDWSQQSTDIS
jgi:hypothetical protein